MKNYALLANFQIKIDIVHQKIIQKQMYLNWGLYHC